LIVLPKINTYYYKPKEIKSVPRKEITKKGNITLDIKPEIISGEGEKSNPLRYNYYIAI
jgi:hypothetical protein